MLILKNYNIFEHLIIGSEKIKIYQFSILDTKMVCYPSQANTKNIDLIIDEIKFIYIYLSLMEFKIFCDWNIQL